MSITSIQATRPASINSEIPKLGRPIVSMLRKDRGGYWSVAFKDFQGTVGVQLQCLPAMKELEEKVFNMLLPQDELSESVIKHFSDVAAACPAFVFIIKSK